MYLGVQSTRASQLLQELLRVLHENASRHSQNLSGVLRENASKHSQNLTRVLRENASKHSQNLSGVLRENASKHSQNLSGVLRENISNHFRNLSGVLREETPKRPRELCKILRENALKHPQDPFQVLCRNVSQLTTVTLLRSPVLTLTVSDLRVICGTRSPRRGLAVDPCVVFLLTLPFSIPPSHGHLREVRRGYKMARQSDTFLRCLLPLHLSTARMPHMHTDLIARHNGGDNHNLTIGCHATRA
jgi:riboflavin synthase